jgi:hypothetical protein
MLSRPKFGRLDYSIFSIQISTAIPHYRFGICAPADRSHPLVIDRKSFMLTRPKFGRLDFSIFSLVLAITILCHEKYYYIRQINHY